MWRKPGVGAILNAVEQREAALLERQKNFCSVLLNDMTVTINNLILHSKADRHIRENNDHAVHCCYCIERCLIYGVKETFFSFSRRTFWNVLKDFMSRDDQQTECYKQGYELIDSINDLNSNWSKMRSWIRLALKEQYLAQFLELMIQDKAFVSSWYEGYCIFGQKSLPEQLVQVLENLKIRSFNMLLNDLRLEADDVWLWVDDIPEKDPNCMSQMHLHIVAPAEEAIFAVAERPSSKPRRIKTRSKDKERKHKEKKKKKRKKKREKRRVSRKVSYSPADTPTSSSASGIVSPTSKIHIASWEQSDEYESVLEETVTEFESESELDTATSVGSLLSQYSRQAEQMDSLISEGHCEQNLEISEMKEPAQTPTQASPSLGDRDSDLIDLRVDFPHVVTSVKLLSDTQSTKQQEQQLQESQHEQEQKQESQSELQLNPQQEELREEPFQKPHEELQEDPQQALHQEPHQEPHQNPQREPHQKPCLKLHQGSQARSQSDQQPHSEEVIPVDSKSSENSIVTSVDVTELSDHDAELESRKPSTEAVVVASSASDDSYDLPPLEPVDLPDLETSRQLSRERTPTEKDSDASPISLRSLAKLLDWSPKELMKPTPVSPESIPELPQPQGRHSQPTPELPPPKPQLPQPKPELLQPKPELTQPKPELPQPKLELPQPKLGLPQPEPQLPQPETQLPQYEPQHPQPEPQLPQPEPDPPQPEPPQPEPPQPEPPQPEPPQPEPQLPQHEPQVPQPEPQLPQPEPQLPQPEPQLPQPEPQLPQPEHQAPQPKPQLPQPEPQLQQPEPQLPHEPEPGHQTESVPETKSNTEHALVQSPTSDSQHQPESDKQDNSAIGLNSFKQIEVLSSSTSDPDTKLNGGSHPTDNVPLTDTPLPKDTLPPTGTPSPKDIQHPTALQEPHQQSKDILKETPKLTPEPDQASQTEWAAKSHSEVLEDKQNTHSDHSIKSSLGKESANAVFYKTEVPFETPNQVQSDLTSPGTSFSPISPLPSLHDRSPSALTSNSTSPKLIPISNKSSKLIHEQMLATSPPQADVPPQLSLKTPTQSTQLPPATDSSTIQITDVVPPVTMNEYTQKTSAPSTIKIPASNVAELPAHLTAELQAKSPTESPKSPEKISKHRSSTPKGRSSSRRAREKRAKKRSSVFSQSVSEFRKPRSNSLIRPDSDVSSLSLVLPHSSNSQICNASLDTPKSRRARRRKVDIAEMASSITTRKSSVTANIEDSISAGEPARPAGRLRINSAPDLFLLLKDSKSADNSTNSNGTDSGCLSKCAVISTSYSNLDFYPKHLTDAESALKEHQERLEKIKNRIQDQDEHPFEARLEEKLKSGIEELRKQHEKEHNEASKKTEKIREKRRKLSAARRQKEEELHARIAREEAEIRAKLDAVIAERKRLKRLRHSQREKRRKERHARQAKLEKRRNIMSWYSQMVGNEPLAINEDERDGADSVYDAMVDHMKDVTRSVSSKTSSDPFDLATTFPLLHSIHQSLPWINSADDTDKNSEKGTEKDTASELAPMSGQHSNQGRNVRDSETGTDKPPYHRTTSSPALLSTRRSTSAPPPRRDVKKHVNTKNSGIERNYQSWKRKRKQTATAGWTPFEDNSSLDSSRQFGEDLSARGRDRTARAIDISHRLSNVDDDYF